MTINIVPDWMVNLEEEDLNFIKNFVLNSGSLKDMAQHYGVTYPTVRLRLDKIIQKIKIEDQMEENSYISLIKRYAIEGKIEFDLAKILISEYRKELQKEENK